MRRAAGLVSVILLVCLACSNDGEGAAPPTSAEPPTTTTSTTAAPAPGEADILQDVVAALADGAMEGRLSLTPGSELAQEYLIEQLSVFAEPLGDDFRHPFEHGVNIIGVIPGAELGDEYLALGAHYDHLGRDCPSAVPGDDVCNGATDNAAGVAAVLEIGRRLAAGDPPRRSVILAFWDAEEQGLLGSRHYVSNPLVPLEATLAYLNWDIQGANLLPSLSDTTIVVGAETGGAPLVDATSAATSRSELEYVALSLLFGQGRSDHAAFAAAGLPVAFFSDATSACYHTAQDDVTVVDFGKLGRQVDTGEALVLELVATDTPPSFVADAPVATYDDAESLLGVVSKARQDFDRFPAEGQETANGFLADLEATVDAGPSAFDDAAMGRLIGGAAAVIELLSQGDCDGFLD